MEKKQRLYEFDVLKGFLVISVLMIHLLPNIYNGLSLERFIGWMLPLFFWVSGYFIRYIPLGKQLGKRIWSVAKPLLIYFTLFTIVVGTYTLLTNTLTISELGRSVVSELLGQPFLDLVAPNFYIKTELHTSMTTFWFYYQFILASLLAFPLLRWIKGSFTKGSITIIILLALSALGYSLNIQFPFYLNMTLFEAALMILGSLQGSRKLHEKIYSLDFPMKVAILLISLALAFSLGIHDPRLSFMSHGEIGSLGAIDPIIGFIEVAAGAIAMIIISKAVCKIKPLKICIGYFGENMVDIVFLHMFVAWLLFRLFNIPIPMNFARSPAYVGSVVQQLMIFGICLLNIGIIVLIIFIKKLIKKKITNKKIKLVDKSN